MKHLGYTNIKIYNGGIKDWKKNGFTLERKKPLPEKELTFIESEELYSMLKELEPLNCKSSAGEPLLTLLDFRNNRLNKSGSFKKIATSCPIKSYHLDDISDPLVRAALPQSGKVVIVTETGNRDEFVIRYLSQYDFKSYSSLKHGMRGWLKKRYPTSE